MLGILAGWGNENSGAAVFFLLIAYFVTKLLKKEKWALFEATGCLGFLTGFIFLVSAPGNYVRADFLASHYQSASLFKRLINVSSLFLENYGFIIIAASIVFGVDLFTRNNPWPKQTVDFPSSSEIKNKGQRIHVFSCFYALSAVSSAYSMILSPIFPGRAFLIVLVFSVITLGSILIQYEQVFIKRNAVIIIALLSIACSFSLMNAGKNIFSIHFRWQKRIDYIMAEKEKGQRNIVVKAPIPAGDRHAALYGLADIKDNENAWPNTAIADYFGLASIKGLDNNDPWEPKWQ